MAYRRKYGKRRATIRRKTMARGRRYRTRVPRNVVSTTTGLGFPKRMTMTCRYAETGTITTGGSGSTSTINYRANGLFDPNQTGGGHQPMYFDQMMSIYNHYICIGSKATITWCQLPDGAGLRPPVTVGVYLNDDTTVTPSFNGILEQSNSIIRNMTQNTGSPVTTACKFSAKKVFGGSVLAAEDLQGTVTTNPAEEQIYTLFVDSGAALTACTVMYRIQIDYITVFRELKDNGGS